MGVMLDRVFFWIFVAAGLLGTIGLFLQPTMSPTHVEPDLNVSHE